MSPQVVFTDPYTTSEMNRWTSPELDDAAASIREDVELRLNASRLKDKFLSSAEVGEALVCVNRIDVACADQPFSTHLLVALWRDESVSRLRFPQSPASDEYT